MRKRDLFTMVSLFLLSLFLMTGCGGGGGGGGGSSETTPNNIAVKPRVARNASGQAVVAYLRQVPGSKLYVNYFDGQNWTGPSQISSGDASDHKVAISSNGVAIVVWKENDFIWAKIYNNGWSQNYQISGPNADEPSVAIDSIGRASVVWNDSGKKVVRKQYIDGSWGDQEVIYDVSQDQYKSISSPLEAIDLSTNLHYLVWLETDLQNPSAPVQRILFSSPLNFITVWQVTSNLPQVGYYLKPTSLMVTCDVIIGIHYTEVEYSTPQNQNPYFTIKTQAYVSINPDGSTQPDPLSNPVTTQVSNYDPNNLPSFVGEPEVVMDNLCNAIGVWQQHEQNSDDVWFNTYKNFQWQGPQKITNDYKSSYSPSVDFHEDGKAILVYTRNSTNQSGVGVFATIADFSNSNIFNSPQKISRDPTLTLGNPMVSKGLVVWEDSKTANAQLPNTIYGRFYNPLQDSWSDIIQIGD